MFRPASSNSRAPISIPWPHNVDSDCIPVAPPRSKPNHEHYPRRSASARRNGRRTTLQDCPCRVNADRHGTLKVHFICLALHSSWTALLIFCSFIFVFLVSFHDLSFRLSTFYAPTFLIHIAQSLISVTTPSLLPRSYFDVSRLFVEVIIAILLSSGSRSPPVYLNHLTVTCCTFRGGLEDAHKRLQEHEAGERRHCIVYRRRA